MKTLKDSSTLPLFQGLDDDDSNGVAQDAAGLSRFPEPKLRVFAKDLSKWALHHLPQLNGLTEIEDVRRYFASNLEFNSKNTRVRNANYLINRFFPDDTVYPDLCRFAEAVNGKPALGESLFYLTCRAEKIVAMVAEEVIFPALPQGGLRRSRIRDYVHTVFPESKSDKQMAISIVNAYRTFGIAEASKTHLKLALRNGSLSSFGYILHLEFPEPGMYAFEKVLNGPMKKWLLWDTAWMVEQLYRLRENGLIAKVSDIDTMRQFTTKFTLDESVAHIVRLAREEVG